MHAMLIVSGSSIYTKNGAPVTRKMQTPRSSALPAALFSALFKPGIKFTQSTSSPQLDTRGIHEPQGSDENATQMHKQDSRGPGATHETNVGMQRHHHAQRRATKATSTYSTPRVL